MRQSRALQAAVAMAGLAAFGAVAGRPRDGGEADELALVPLEPTTPLPPGKRERHSRSIADKPHEHKREIARRLRQEARLAEKRERDNAG